VVGNMVGSGIFLLPASLAQAAGPISILGWVFTGAGAMLLALVFAKLGRAFPRTGGPYAYAREAFGDFVGFQTWGYWIAVWAGNAAIAVAFVGYAGAGTTAHEVGLRDLLGAARLTGGSPEALVLHGAQPAVTAPGAEITPALRAALDPLVDRIIAELALWGHATRLRNRTTANFRTR
jgi:amino acid transporter